MTALVWIDMSLEACTFEINVALISDLSRRTINKIFITFDCAKCKMGYIRLAQTCTLATDNVENKSRSIKIVLLAKLATAHKARAK